MVSHQAAILPPYLHNLCLTTLPLTKYSISPTKSDNKNIFDQIHIVDIYVFTIHISFQGNFSKKCKILNSSELPKTLTFHKNFFQVKPTI